MNVKIQLRTNTRSAVTNAIASNMARLPGHLAFAVVSNIALYKIEITSRMPINFKVVIKPHLSFILWTLIKLFEIINKNIFTFISTSKSLTPFHTLVYFYFSGVSRHKMPTYQIVAAWFLRIGKVPSTWLSYHPACSWIRKTIWMECVLIQNFLKREVSN